MATVLTALLLSMPILAGGSWDPMPGVFTTREDARNLDCTVMTEAAARDLYPGLVPPPAGRTLAGTSRDAMICRRRFVRLGERPARDEVILATLRRTAGDIVQAASAQVSRPVTWHVDAFYPDVAVATKIAVATKTELAERGQRVSDRVPVLAAGDVAVLSRMEPTRAFPAACARYVAEGVVGKDDAFIAVVLVDPRETQLHAGLCVDGAWKWFR